MLSAILPLLLLSRAIIAQVTPYDVCAGYVSNAALPTFLYNDTTSSQSECWILCDDNEACLCVAWGSTSQGNVRCNLFATNIDPTTLVANPFEKLDPILVAYKREPNSQPTANLPSGCVVAGLNSTTSSNSTIVTNANATVTSNSTSIPIASATLNATVNDTPTTSLNSSVLNATATATVSVSVAIITGNATVTSAPVATGRNPANVSSIIALSSSPSSATTTYSSSSQASSSSSAAPSSTSSSAAIPSSTTISSSTVGSGTCYYYIMVYPDSSSCCPGVSLGLSAAASRFRKRDDNSTLQADVAPIVIVASYSEAAPTDVTSNAPPTASTPAADLTAPTTFADFSSSASVTSSSSASAAPSASASASSGPTCATTTIVRSCADPSQDSETTAYLDGYKGLSGSALTIECGSVGTFTY